MPVLRRRDEGVVRAVQRHKGGNALRNIVTTIDGEGATFTEGRLDVHYNKSPCHSTQARTPGQ